MKSLVPENVYVTHPRVGMERLPTRQRPSGASDRSGIREADHGLGSCRSTGRTNPYGIT
ncbi:hypothetical protein PSEEN0972 [Pseudomonas entomophila L48]|uniref:Uncharacterized protein n=1 Tax=Pseudomonas entomophila (strain L48) TaxID=384676 RepID=Q1IEM8_PSEE4|nr:hypothetical protein PSEEN0972 [Pseudomonas entomophila L48]